MNLPTSPTDPNDLYDFLEAQLRQVREDLASERLQNATLRRAVKQLLNTLAHMDFVMLTKDYEEPDA